MNNKGVIIRLVIAIVKTVVVLYFEIYILLDTILLFSSLICLKYIIYSNKIYLILLIYRNFYFIIMISLVALKVKIFMN